MSILLVELADTQILLKVASWQGHESDLEVNETLTGNKKPSSF